MSNDEVIMKGMQQFIENRVHNDILNTLERIADRIILYLEDDVIPVDTHNLQDSTGIGIYHGDVLKRYIPRQMATEARANGQNSPIYPETLTERTNIWGHKELQRAITEGAMKYSNDYCLVIFSSMPYAGLVDMRTQYFEAIIDELKPLVVRILKQANTK